MDEELCRMDIHDLTSFYEREFDKLKLLLFKAEDWDLIRVQQKIVTDLSSAMHQRLFRTQRNPAEYGTRPNL